MTEHSSHALQLAGSLIVALLIVIVTVALVNARFPLEELPHEQSEEQQDADQSGRGRGRGRSGDD